MAHTASLGPLKGAMSAQIALPGGVAGKNGGDKCFTDNGFTKRKQNKLSQWPDLLSACLKCDPFLQVGLAGGHQLTSHQQQGWLVVAQVVKYRPTPDAASEVCSLFEVPLLPAEEEASSHQPEK